VNESETSMSPNLVNNSDDLQKIKGIGKTIAQALNELGINRYAELATYSPSRLIEMLKDKFPPVTLQRAKIEEWIQQAQALANSEASPSPSSKSEESIARSEDQEEHDWTEKRPPTARGSWLEIADFFVSFGFEVDEEGEEHLKTRAHHSQADQLMQWDGVASEDLVNWLLDRANLSVPAPSVATRADSAELGPADREEEPYPISLSNPWVSEVQVPVLEGGQNKMGYLRVQSNMIMSGPASETYMNEGLEYAVDVYLVDTETNRSTLAGTYQDRLIPSTTLYTIEKDFPIPPVGRYQLYLIARLSPPASLIAHTQGPIIHVEP